MNRLSIRSRVLLLAAILLAMLIGTDLFASRILQHADRAREKQRQVGIALAANSQVRSAYADLRHRRTADDGDTTRTSNPAIDADAALKRISDALGQLATFDQGQAARLRSEILSYDAAATQSHDPIQQNLAQERRVVVGKHLDELDRRLSAAENKARVALDQVLAVTVVDETAIGATVIGLLTTAVVLQSILASLRQIRKGLEGIESGNFHLVVPRAGGGDIGALGRVVQRLQQAQQEREALAAENHRQSRILAEAIATFQIGFALFDDTDRMLICNPVFAKFHEGSNLDLKPGILFSDLQQACLEHGLVDDGTVSPDTWLERRLAQRALMGNFEMRLGERLLSITERRTKDAVTVEVMTDVTATRRREADLERARDEAEHANRVKSEFLANMSHELRTPLNAIIGYSQILSEDAVDEGNTAMVDDLRKIEGAGKHLLGLINDVLDLSKIEAGKMDVFIELVDLEGLANDVRLMVEPLASANGNTLRIEGASEVGKMACDVTKLKQSLLNLLSNACKFTTAGQVGLTIRRQPGSVVFAVSDTGIGIPLDKQQSLFEAFHQVDSSTTRRYGGTGLGLAITRSFARTLGGDVSLHSEEGRGSVFTIVLPDTLSPTAIEEDEAGAGQEMLPAGLSPGQALATVLVTDDEDAARRIIGTHLSREGYRVIYARSGPEALEIARRERPDAITLDIMMPQQDGWSVLQALKADPELSPIPVVLVSIAADRGLAFALGAAAVLTKPVDRAELAAALRLHRSKSVAAPVLIVEDDPAVRAVTIRSVEQLGLTAAIAEDGSAALAWLAANPPPGLILLDLMMPVMDGFEFLQHLRDRPQWAEIPVVVLTAKTLTPAERDQLARSTQRVVTKLGEQTGLSEVLMASRSSTA